MNKKVLMAICAAVVALGVGAFSLVRCTSQKAEAPGVISTPAVVAPDAETVEEGSEEPTEEGSSEEIPGEQDQGTNDDSQATPTDDGTEDESEPAKMKLEDVTYKDAVRFAEDITTRYDYNAEGWNELVEDAAAMHITVDDSVKGAFDYYATEKQTNIDVLGSYNVSSTYIRTSIEPEIYSVTVNAMVAQAVSMEASKTSETRAQIVKALRDSVDENYFSTVKYTLVFDPNGAGIVLSCDTPDWFRANEGA